MAADDGMHRYFLTGTLPRLLRTAAQSAPPGDVVDLGCADGAMAHALEQAGLAGERIYAVDLEPEHVAFCETISPKIQGVVADCTAVEALPDACADGVVAAMIIEHVEDDRALAPEIARLLRPGGWFFVSTVLRKRRAFWIYRRDGHAVLDPTHIREYGSVAEVEAALADPRLELAETTCEPLRFPLVDLALKLLSALRLVPEAARPRLYERLPRFLLRSRVVALRVPGYFVVETRGVRRSAAGSP